MIVLKNFDLLKKKLSKKSPENFVNSATQFIKLTYFVRLYIAPKNILLFW